MRKIIDASPNKPPTPAQPVWTEPGLFFRETLGRNLSPKNGQNADLYKIWWGRIGQALTIYRQDVLTKILTYIS
jgi:hypothetical protein